MTQIEKCIARQIAEDEVAAILVRNGARPALMVEFRGSGETLTWNELVDRRLVKHGPRIATMARRHVANWYRPEAPLAGGK